MLSGCFPEGAPKALHAISGSHPETIEKPSGCTPKVVWTLSINASEMIRKAPARRTLSGSPPEIFWAPT
eukprot:1822314-Alexandrium_andersonii.AAC.1